MSVSPEIINDLLFNVIIQLVSNIPEGNMLEIGSSTGEGSTQAFIRGMEETKTNLYCLEVSKERFSKLVKNVNGNPRVRCFNMSSVGLWDFPDEKTVTYFHKNIDSYLSRYPLKTVLEWLKQDQDFILKSNAEPNGIVYIKDRFGIENFDVVLIDGSEFTGYSEFTLLYGAKVFILDDTNSFKNYFPYKILLDDSAYQLVAEDKKLRHGFAVFGRVK